MNAAVAKASAPEPLAPRANAELLGQAVAERSLLEAHLRARLPHAWLLTGPRGIGKATLAYRFARFLLNDGAPDLFGAPPADLAIDPESETFRRVASGGHADLFSVERAVNPSTDKPRREIVVDDVRRAVHFLRMTSAGGGRRVVVVDSADEMNLAAANALLKLLEEPPAQALLLLVSHTPGGLLPTLRSRCRHLALASLDEAQVVRLLSRHAPDLAAADAAALARLAEGSIGRALALADGGGLALYRELIEILGGLPRLDVARLHALGDRLAKGDGAVFRTASELFAWWLARMIRAGAGAGLPPDVVAGEGPLMTRLLARRDLAQWIALWEKVTRLFARTDGASLDRKQVIVTAFLEIEALCA